MKVERRTIGSVNWGSSARWGSSEGPYILFLHEAVQVIGKLLSLNTMETKAM